MTGSVISGWGRSIRSHTDLVDHLPEAITGRGVLARGGGQSYGDAALNSGGALFVCPADRITINARAGLADVAAGVSLRDLCAATVPSGLLPAVLPGSLSVTVGGAIAADVHGKNHLSVGGFGTHVRSLTLNDGSGSTRHLTAAGSPAAFWATIGGMGLTGLIEGAQLSLMSIPTTWMNVQDSRHSTLQEVMEAMAVAEDGEHLAAWIDLAHRGGRGILTRSTFATSPDGLDLDDRRRRAVPPKLPRLVTPLTVRAFGAAKYARSRPDLHRMPVWDALFPLDRVEGWEAAYGPAGMVQYQFVSPTPDPILEAVDAITQQPVPAFLGVLKRLGTESGGMLSFPMPGWTLAVDFPADPRLRQLFEQLDEFVVNAGGRVYLAKDGRLSQATFAQMYPRVQEWKSVRDELDPAGQFQSDLGRRLGLTDREGTSNA